MGGACITSIIEVDTSAHLLGVGYHRIKADGKFVMIDPSGTDRHWQGRIDLHELEAAQQAHMGVPPDQCLRVQEDSNLRESNSWEYLSLDEVEPDRLLVTYGVQRFREHWNSYPVQGVHMVCIALER